MVGDELDHRGYVLRRSSSAWATYANAFRRISFARFSSRTSRSSSFNRSRSLVVRPGRCPASRCACRTHVRRVSAVQPSFGATDCSTAHAEAWASRCSSTIRTARSRTSGENRLGRPIDPILPDALSGLNDLDIFSFDDVLPLAATAGKTDPDDIPETPKNPVTRKGDLWVLGKHRIVCGDSTDPKPVERLLDGAEPDLMVTDPPYGVSYDSSWRYKAGISSKDGAFGKSVNDDTDDWQAAYALFPGRIAYVWMSSLALPVAARGLDACGFVRRSLIIWDKGHIVIGRGHYHWRHETCWYAVKKGAKANWKGGRKASTLWEIDNPGNLKPATRPRSPLSACSEPFTTTMATSTIRSSVQAPRLSPVSRRAEASTRSRSSPRTSM